jgi:hypothetical protein
VEYRQALHEITDMNRGFEAAVLRVDAFHRKNL